MPLTTYVCLVTFMSFVLPAAAVVLTTEAVSPTTRDAYSVVGAMLASLIVSLHEGAPGSRTPWRPRVIASLISSSFVGSVCPGLIVYTILPFVWTKAATSLAEMTWHGWAASGFVMGLLGWGIVRGLLAIRERLPGKMQQEAERLWPTHDRGDKPPPDTSGK